MPIVCTSNFAAPKCYTSYLTLALTSYSYNPLLPFMGSCCVNTQKNIGIPVDFSARLSSGYSQDGILTQSDMVTILKLVFTLQYNEKLYEKRALQAQRARALREGFGERYLELAEETQDLERLIFACMEKRVLQELNVASKVYYDAKDYMDMKDIVMAAMADVLQAIRDSRQRLGLRNSGYKKLLTIYQSVYNECDFILNSQPDTALRFSNLYDEESYLSCEDVMMSDALYKEFKLLPIEIYALIEIE